MLKFFTHPTAATNLKGERVFIGSPASKRAKENKPEGSLDDLIKNQTEAFSRSLEALADEYLGNLEEKVVKRFTEELGQMIKRVGTDVYGLQSLITASSQEKKENHREIMALAEKIMSRPFPKFPTQMEASNMDANLMHQITQTLASLAQNQDNISKNLTIISENLERLNAAIEEPKVGKAEPQLPQPTSVKIIRHKAKWVVATSPQLSGTDAIVGDIDGSNTAFYLPGVPVKNSEQVRLNGGAPLSYGADYSITGNRIAFTVAPPSGSKLEVKYQL